MRTAIVYRSVTGNTAQVARAILDAVGAERVDYCGAPAAEIQAEFVFVGSWTDKGICDEETAAFLKQLHGKQVAYFGTAGFGGSAAYYEALFSRVRLLIPEDNQVLPPFFCQGKMPDTVRARYQQMCCAHPDDEKLRASLDNFDRARSHPDEADLAAVRRWALESMDQMGDTHFMKEEENQP